MTIDKVLKNRPIKDESEWEGFLSYHYRFRYNVVTGRTEVYINEGWEPIDDYNFNSIYWHMRRQGGTISQRRLQSLLQSDFVDKYHPFRAYFNGLPDWDRTDWIEELAGQVQTTDQDFWQKCLKKWLVAMVASSIDEDESVVNQTVLILQGKQGVGKSTFLNNLVPPALDDYVYSGTINPGNKDSIIHLSETILCQLDELETLTRYKESAIKELITKSEIRIRRPYGHFADKLNRHASLCGSINQSTMLNDSTGSRRFLIHKVQAITYDHDIDMDKVFSQALALYRDGFQYWFDGAQIQQIHAHNQQFQNQTVEEELLLARYQKADPDDSGARRLQATKILKRLHDGRLPSASHSGSIRLGQALAKHGFQHSRSKGKKYWYVKSAKDSSKPG